ncbi:putative nuclease HARBI1 [Gigantopelta aegis]|uniref:putative nuclease HARBI1 n=1 Tax=Gigantopelta aegis TaxID=1735272 RepID=UPI001B88E213|nr:putative nuclease HARBI1 [Gigantopelta aegis]
MLVNIPVPTCEQDLTKRRAFKLLLLMKKRWRNIHMPVIKTGVACTLFLDMDNYTLRRHIRLNREQLDTFIRFLTEFGHDDPPVRFGGPPQISLELKALMFLWYMSNVNSFREMSDKFNVGQGSAHQIITKILMSIHHLSHRYIKWPDEHEKIHNTRQFFRTSGQENIIGAVDGCHFAIIRPAKSGISYLNRKGYYSVLLQGVCDWKGKSVSVFIGPPGRVHDARMLRKSDLYAEKGVLLGNQWKLLGDSAYVSNDFPFIITPKRDNGNLTAADIQQNTNISKGRVIIENAFGMMKCRFRRVRDIQNTNLELVVRIILAACTLHSMLIEDGYVCPDHPDGCLRDDADDNDDAQ